MVRVGLYSLLCCCHCIVICYVSYVIDIVKEASHKFREGTNDLSQAQSGGLELIVGDRGSEKRPGSFEKPNVESVSYTYKVELRVRFREGTMTSRRWVNVALHYIKVMQMRFLNVVEYCCMELCEFDCNMGEMWIHEIVVHILYVYDFIGCETTLIFCSPFVIGMYYHPLFVLLHLCSYRVQTIRYLSRSLM